MGHLVEVYSQSHPLHMYSVGATVGRQSGQNRNNNLSGGKQAATCMTDGALRHLNLLRTLGIRIAATRYYAGRQSRVTACASIVCSLTTTDLCGGAVLSVVNCSSRPGKMAEAGLEVSAPVCVCVCGYPPLPHFYARGKLRMHVHVCLSQHALLLVTEGTPHQGAGAPGVQRMLVALRHELVRGTKIMFYLH